jgi:hypothetical protein
MPRRPAKVTQADISRAIRAAKETGASEVRVESNGTIRIVLMENTGPIHRSTNLDEVWTPSEPLKRHLKRTESG